MSTSASSLNWWYIDGRRRCMNSGVPPAGDVQEDAAVGRAPAGLYLAVDGPGHLVPGQQLGWPAVVGLVVYQRSASSMLSAVSALKNSGM